MADKKVTMQTIANELGISRMTVSKAFKGNKDISADTREKIFQVATTLGYNYKTSSHSTVLVVVNSLYLELDEQFYTKVYKKLIQESTYKNITLIQSAVTKEMEKTLKLPYINAKDVDGIIILGELSIKYIEAFKSMQLPTVLMDFYNSSIHMDSIITNNYLYSYEITSHLITNGHNQIGFVGNISSTSSIQDRYLGYYKALLENDIPINSDFVIHDRNEKGLLKKFDLPKSLPTAFVCNNDYTALHLIDYLEKHGHDVPADISVVGFDDILDLEQSTHHLTTVRIDIDAMAQLGIRRISQVMAKKESKARTYVVNSHLILRDTVKDISNQ